MGISKEATERVRTIFQIISHPTRIALLEFLESSDLESSEAKYYNVIKSWFYHISDSTLRYHLNKLIDVKYITKSDNDYIITDIGKKVLKFSRESSKAIAEFK